jgi:hypothetical protein
MTRLQQAPPRVFLRMPTRWIKPELVDGLATFDWCPSFAALRFEIVISLISRRY